MASHRTDLKPGPTPTGCSGSASSRTHSPRDTAGTGMSPRPRPRHLRHPQTAGGLLEAGQCSRPSPRLLLQNRPLTNSSSGVWSSLGGSCAPPVDFGVSIPEQAGKGPRLCQQKPWLPGSRWAVWGPGAGGHWGMGSSGVCPCDPTVAALPGVSVCQLRAPVPEPRVRTSLNNQAGSQGPPFPGQVVQRIEPRPGSAQRAYCVPPEPPWLGRVNGWDPVCHSLVACTALRVGFGSVKWTRGHGRTQRLEKSGTLIFCQEMDSN